MKLLHFSLGLFVSACCLTGCGDKVAGGMSTVPTDSLEYSSEGDSVLHCSLKVDFPTSQDSFSLAVADFVANELQSLYLPVYIGENHTDPVLKYTGSVTDGRAMVDFYGKANYAWLQKEAAEFKESTGAGAVGMECSIALRKIEDNPKYVSYQTTTYMYLGGAHGSSSIKVANILKPSGKRLTQTIDTLKLKEMQPMLRKGVLAYINANSDSSITDSSLNDYLFIEGDLIPLPTTLPYLAADGLHFVYQQYEIAPYAMGIITFTVPYAEAKSFMTAEAKALVE